LARTGLPNREIAQRLFISVRTVGNHLNHIYTKLGVNSRDELRDYFERSG
jgi:DNA-binding CsgD family transcriptional regulator